MKNCKFSFLIFIFLTIFPLLTTWKLNTYARECANKAAAPKPAAAESVQKPDSALFFAGLIRLKGKMLAEKECEAANEATTECEKEKPKEKPEEEETSSCEASTFAPATCAPEASPATLAASPSTCAPETTTSAPSCGAGAGSGSQVPKMLIQIPNSYNRKAYFRPYENWQPQRFKTAETYNYHNYMEYPQVESIYLKPLPLSSSSNAQFRNFRGLNKFRNGAQKVQLEPSNYPLQYKSQQAYISPFVPNKNFVSRKQLAEENDILRRVNRMITHSPENMPDTKNFLSSNYEKYSVNRNKEYLPKSWSEMKQTRAGENGNFKKIYTPAAALYEPEAVGQPEACDQATSADEFEAVNDAAALDDYTSDDEAMNPFSIERDFVGVNDNTEPFEAIPGSCKLDMDNTAEQRRTKRTVRKKRDVSSHRGELSDAEDEQIGRKAEHLKNAVVKFKQHTSNLHQSGKCGSVTKLKAATAKLLESLHDNMVMQPISKYSNIFGKHVSEPSSNMAMQKRFVPKSVKTLKTLKSDLLGDADNNADKNQFYETVARRKGDLEAIQKIYEDNYRFARKTLNFWDMNINDEDYMDLGQQRSVFDRVKNSSWNRKDKKYKQKRRQLPNKQNYI